MTQKLLIIGCGNMGGAMLAGFSEAARLGYTHVLQIDADGPQGPGAPRTLVTLQGMTAQQIGTAQFLF